MKVKLLKKIRKRFDYHFDRSRYIIPYVIYFDKISKTRSSATIVGFLSHAVFMISIYSKNPFLEKEISKMFIKREQKRQLNSYKKSRAKNVVQTGDKFYSRN